MLFKRTVVAGVQLPRPTWEPIRKLHDVHGVTATAIADAYGVGLQPLIKVLYAARLNDMDTYQDSDYATLVEDRLGF